MLLKKSIIFALISSFAFTPLATAVENDRTTEIKKDNNPLPNKCESTNTIPGDKTSKYLDSQSTKLLNQRHLAKFASSPKELVDEVWQIVYQQYVDPDFNQVDWLALRGKYLQKSYQDYPQAYADIKKMLSLLEDSFTKFLTPEEYEQLTGGRKKSSIDGHIARDRAKENRLKALLKELSLLELEKIDNLQNIPKNIRIAEANTAEAPTVSSEIKDLGDRRIGYIRLTRFDNSAASKTRQAIKDAESQQVSGYVLDLRSNPGGLLLSAVEIGRMFLQQGTIVNILARSEAESERYDASNKALTDKPLTVLVNKESASGTEILASALQENNRATVIGENTFGQGSIQSVRSLSNGSGLAVTVARFLTANCNKIEDAGIKPEIVVMPTSSELSKLASNSSLLGSSEDLVYNKALEALRLQF